MPDATPIAGKEGGAEKACALRRPLTFPRSRRLLASNRFREIFDGNGEVVGRSIVVWIGQGASCNQRLGVVASKRTFHDAVDRNRAKRLIRESFRLLQHEFTDAPWDLVVLARRRILSERQPDIQKELRRLCRRKGIVKEDTP